jgi:hypothetical protein
MLVSGLKREVKMEGLQPTKAFVFGMVVALLLISIAPAIAEIVYLKDGTTLRGEPSERVFPHDARYLRRAFDKAV